MHWQTRLVSWIVFLIAKILSATWRFEYLNRDRRARAEAAHKSGSFCLAVWHEHVFAAILAHRGEKFSPLASQSRDGDLATAVMTYFGFRPVRGSSSKGGREARDELVAVTESGWFTAISIDGPRGPRRQVKGGIVDVARRTGAAILPIIVTGNPQWALRSWDRFKIPKPFARVVVNYGEPITVAPDTDGMAFGAVKEQVGATLARLDRETNRHLGLSEDADG